MKNEPIEGQDKILRYGTADGQEPMIDTLASLARTALSDPAAIGLPYEDGVNDCDPQVAIDYALDCLDSIIDALNPATETAENLAASVEILGCHLAERADVLRGIDADGDERYVEAATDLSNALDLIDSALVALREEAS